MAKKTKNQCVVSEEDSFVSSYPVRENLKKWVDTEFKRLVSRGRNTNKFFADTDPDSNTLIIVSDEYILKFNMDEGVIDLVINTEEDSSIWDDVIENVPVQFASCFDNPVGFLYRLSTTKSKEKWHYGFKRDNKESGTLFPIIGFNEMPQTLIR